MKNERDLSLENETHPPFLPLLIFSFCTTLFPLLHPHLISPHIPAMFALLYPPKKIFLKKSSFLPLPFPSVFIPDFSDSQIRYFQNKKSCRKFENFKDANTHTTNIWQTCH